MKCSCNGTCRQAPYKCSRGDWSRQYDPDYGRNMDKFDTVKKEINDTYKQYENPQAVKSVVKD